jgi:hypothetical protein
MNTSKLQKQYDKLTMRERFALIWSAEARKDEQELAALLDAAPRTLAYRFIDAYPLLHAMDITQLCTIIDLLDAAYLLCLLAHHDSERSFNAVKLGSYVFCVKLDAWRKVCAEWGVEADADMKAFPAWHSILFAEQIARAMSLTVEEASDWATVINDAEDELITVESATVSLREGLKRMAAQWE